MCPLLPVGCWSRAQVLGAGIIHPCVRQGGGPTAFSAEKVLVPILDILQSIPILVFLPIPLTFFHRDLPRQPARPRDQPEPSHRQNTRAEAAIFASRQGPTGRGLIPASDARLSVGNVRGECHAAITRWLLSASQSAREHALAGYGHGPR